ncbi:MAG TPA: pyruvate kinase [Chthoniobacteraceae bacterium]|nr:pyruvate kinase [Chthoniobacteraceae bacterium]
MHKTKIICTLGPATESDEILRQMIEAGTDVFRLNMSHATHEWVREIVPRIRNIAKESGTIVGILMDTQGPAIRTGDLPSKLDLKVGDIFEFTVRGERSEEVYSVGVNYDGLVDDISVGDTVLVDNGVIHMKVLAKTGAKIRCEVLTPGLLGNRRHINLPGVKVNLPPLTEKDLADVAVGAELGVDFMALSFCREASDIDALRGVLREHHSTARIVAKIEDQLAVKNINEIIRRTDLVMVARGDLGIECPMEELPIIQRKIVKRCIMYGVPVIVATHMLESMISNPVPTRAEVTDVANAVFEEADAIMLSGETTVGKYPLKCVEALVKISKRIEASGGLGFAGEAILEDNRQRTVRSAVLLANSISDAKIVIFTRRGTMADFVSNLRPKHSPIHAFAPTWELCRKLILNRGVTPHFLPFDHNPTRTIGLAENYLMENGLARSGEHLVIVTDILAGEDRFDSIQLRVIP